MKMYIKEKIEYLTMIAELIDICEERKQWYMIDNEETGEKREPEKGEYQYEKYNGMKKVLADLSRLAD